MLFIMSKILSKNQALIINTNKVRYF